jgi:serine/threonine-protein kinase
LGREVAVKILRFPGADRAARAAFERETLPAARLSHPNLITVLEAFRRRGLFAVVTDWVAGCNLAELVEQSGPLPIATACGIALQTAGALRHAHEHGLVHGMLDPGNVFLADLSGSLSHIDLAAPGLAVKLLNLGLGWRALRLNGDGELLRPSEYLAPEQLNGPGEPDPRADLYALGGCLYLMLTGRAPGTPGACPPAEDLRPDVPPDLAAVLRRLLARDPGRRYRDAGQVIAALRPFRERLSAAELNGTSGGATVAELSDSATMPLLSLRRPAEAPEERTWDVMKHLVYAGIGGLAAAVAAHFLRALW